MKDNPLDGHRGKVALSDPSALKCELKSSPPVAAAAAAASDGTATTNFDDDYNEWELGIGDLIIDLDADIEKTNGHATHNGNDSSSSAPGAFNFLGGSSGNLAIAPNMSNSKSSRLAASSAVVGTVAGANSASAPGPGTFEHQATVDKGLKMKIKRKTVGSKYSEAKHEIVQSDTKSASAHPLTENINASNSNSCSGAAIAADSPVAGADTPKSKHSSGKGRNSSHREKKEKNREKDKGGSASRNNSTPSTATPEVNGTLVGGGGGGGGVMSPLKISSVSISSPAPPSLCSNSSPLNSNTPASSPGLPRPPRNGPASSPVAADACQAMPSTSPPMPNLTIKLEGKFASSLPSPSVKVEDCMESPPPQKRIKLENSDVKEDAKDEFPASPSSPEMKDTSTCTSVGTVVEPDCLGPCEPGTSVMLEGIVWQETEGGVLVVNVTWRGKTYVGTLLDCTKHDWAPPRFCESPTSDVDSKTNKGRGKRGRGNNTTAVAEINTFTDARNCVQSKLRNGKGRRTTINSNAASSGFTVPSSPAKGDTNSNTNKRKGRPNDSESTTNQNTTTPTESNKSNKRNRTQSNRTTPTSTAPAELPQPSSPQLITCPEPNCNKKYKHINGLKYHQTHAHSSGSDGSSSKTDDTATEDSKDVTNSSDNEESMQESASASTSPAPTFANAVPPGGKSLGGGDNASSSSSSMSGLPEGDPFSLTTDLSTLASVAIGDSKAVQKVGATPQDMSSSSSDGDNNAAPASVLPVSSSSLPLSPPLSTAPAAPAAEGLGLSTAAAAVTTSVIQSSSSLENVSQQVNGSIPATHVIFNQGLIGTNSPTTCTYTSSVVCSNSNSLSPSNSSLSPSVTTTFVTMSSIASTAVSSPSSLPLIDKNKIKQERPDKYISKSPLPSPSIRPIVPAPTPQLVPISSNVPGSHPGLGIPGLGAASPLKPIQPKPTIMGEPSTVNPALECLKKDKMKHKKKSRDKERDKKMSSLPLNPSKIGMNPSEDSEALELTAYPSLDIVPGTLPGTPHAALSPHLSQAKPPETSLDMSLPDDTINENIQSPAYSDISDANDTAPVLESEVPSVKEKEDKIGKTTPDASQSPVANISAYGMYPYYSQPPYLLPSVSPQSQGPAIIEKPELVKKSEPERVKENRPWSNPSSEIRERQHSEQEPDKKPPREEITPIPNSPATAGVPVQEYQIPQHYPYPYGYVQGYPYPVDSSAYDRALHMHMIESDPHYKQQYKQFMDEQHHRMYKEQQQMQQLQHPQQQQQQQQQAAAAAHHHAAAAAQLQHQQQQQQQQQHAHHHQSHHQSKSHHASVKEDRERSRESSKDRNSGMEKMQNSGGGMHADHPSKIQHSSMALSSGKDQDVREIDTRPPSLPAQSRMETMMSSSAAALKEKQNENHQILKENIELKSQMEEGKSKVNQYEMAMLYERHREDMRREDMRRYYMYDKVIEQQQARMDPGIHHHTHHHQTIQSHSHMQGPSYSSPSLKALKEEPGSIPNHGKSNHYGDSTRSSVVSPAKSDHHKSHHLSSSSPKGSIRERDSSHVSSKEYMNSVSARDPSGGKSKESSGSSKGDRAESSIRDDKKVDKVKVEPKVESEGQKPTMETTGPPPPPTNSYAYLHPSYLQPPHFPHLPFEPAHAAMYARGGMNPMLVSAPHYGNPSYVHPQIRYVAPGVELPPHHAAPPDPLKLHPAAAGPPKALDLLHQVSQHYTTQHKIHELQEHALMSPTPASAAPASSAPASSAGQGGKAPAEPPAAAASVSKVDGSSRDASRSPPTQRHLHTHHHTHVGVGYPIYDPYGVTAQKTYT